MNEITVHGNVTGDPELRHGRGGGAFLTFSVAVNRGFRSRDTGKWIEQPAVFHRVVAFRTLAENAAQTLQKGIAVTVVGQLADDSYEHAETERLVRRQRLEATDIAVSLRWATAEVTRQRREDSTDHTPADTAEPVAA